MDIGTKDEVFSGEPAADLINLKPVGIIRSEIKEPMLGAGDEGNNEALLSGKSFFMPVFCCGFRLGRREVHNRWDRSQC